MYFGEILSFLLFFINNVYCNIHEERLFKNLMDNLSPMERPVFNSSEAVVVKMRFFLQQIMDVDEKNQVVQVNAWIRYSWNDYKLKWNPEEYDNITDIRFNGNTDSIWKPDILLYNSYVCLIIYIILNFKVLMKILIQHTSQTLLYIQMVK